MRAVRASTKKKRRISPARAHDIPPLRVSPRNRSTTPPPHVTDVSDMPPFSEEDALKISVVKASIRDFVRIPMRKEDTSPGPPR